VSGPQFEEHEHSIQPDEGAVEMVFREDFSGRVRFVSHAVREIRNRLPNVIAGYKAGIKLQYKNRLDAILKVWKTYGLPLGGSLPEQITRANLLRGACPRQR